MDNQPSRAWRVSYVQKLYGMGSSRDVTKGELFTIRWRRMISLSSAIHELLVRPNWLPSLRPCSRGPHCSPMAVRKIQDSGGSPHEFPVLFQWTIFFMTGLRRLVQTVGATFHILLFTPDNNIGWTFRSRTTESAPPLLSPETRAEFMNYDTGRAIPAGVH